MNLKASILEVGKKNPSFRKLLVKEAGLGDWIREKHKQRQDSSEQKRTEKTREKKGPELEDIGGGDENFRKYVESRGTFRSDKTKNDVKFDSLPEDQQRKIYQDWKRDKEAKEEKQKAVKKRDKKQNVKDDSSLKKDTKGGEVQTSDKKIEEKKMAPKSAPKGSPGWKNTQKTRFDAKLKGWGQKAKPLSTVQSGDKSHNPYAAGGKRHREKETYRDERLRQRVREKP